MLRRRGKRIQSECGFTLIELLAVMVILGLILAIGVPKYTRVQAQAEYDADVAMINSLAKAAEIYVVQKDINLITNNSVLISKLIQDKAIDGTIVLNRKNVSGNSVKNTNPIKKLSDYGTQTFQFDTTLGTVTNLSALTVTLIGNPLY